MLSLTRKTDYALVALAGLAEQAPASASAHDLAGRLRLPLPALRNILKRLAQHGLVMSTQGAAGGYRLAKPAEQITIAQVVQAIEGPVRLAMCCGADSATSEAHPCRLEGSCRIKATVQGIHRQLVDFLDRVNLAQIAACDVQTGFATEGAEASNSFEIAGSLSRHIAQSPQPQF